MLIDHSSDRLRRRLRYVVNINETESIVVRHVTASLSGPYTTEKKAK
jgi:hypothetical protein